MPNWHQFLYLHICAKMALLAVRVCLTTNLSGDLNIHKAFDISWLRFCSR